MPLFEYRFISDPNDPGKKTLAHISSMPVVCSKCGGLVPPLTPLKAEAVTITVKEGVKAYTSQKFVHLDQADCGVEKQTQRVTLASLPLL